ncbi:phosphatidylglycerol lysyltransferase domain-containing protein [Phaeobacter sp. PT47_59]|uniref:phosphatidylglycerol lysyltransferase domain-containing protein n=1 Tax=Phaeobacter sp. PT47_59 TaxID=3029979 RepID=UPI002380A053|nr:phosphatidylglycerol lysyltransferase domain-containing protein [Phaeobacter sp. PT47_59]MDE4174673.1 phosphatidylglycerol lysyltransferase domain-containing protein [Phaeobacter sp. PT47_59]
MINSHRTLSGSVRTAFRWTAPVAMALLCLWALDARIGLPSLADLGATLAALPGWKWAAACLATAISFWALGRYDSVAHRHLRTGLDSPRAQRAGMAAIAFSQATGFGLITGAYARWRLMPGLKPVQAAQITALVGFTFMMTLAAISGAALLIVPVLPGTGWLGIALLSGFLAAVAASFWFPALRIGRLQLRWPSLIAMAALLGWTALDVVAAGSALWLLLPDTVDVAWSTLVTVYFIALGAAILSSAPGGAGPLELTVCALLPGTDTGALLAALVAFRLVYYALPAALACTMMLLPRRTEAQSAPPEDAALLGTQQRPAASIPAGRPCSEAAIIRQNGGHVQALGLNQLAVLDSPQSTIAFFDLLSGQTGEVFAPFATYGRQRNASVCFYKCSARTGTEARRARWKVLRLAAEAVVCPPSFSESGSSHRQLRRKLRHAEKAGVTALPAAASLPIDQMAEIDHAWQTSHGKAYGTTMGRFEPGYLTHQHVFLAWKDGRLEGFISLHHSDGEWCLDLIRIRPDAPDGTSHALVRAAIAAAAAAEVPRLSLAAVPDHRWAHRFDRGLRRFKSCFAPTWEPRYIAAPSWGQMALSLAEILRLVHRPDPVRPVAPAVSAHEEQPAAIGFAGVAEALSGARIHDEVEQKAIALNGAP